MVSLSSRGGKKRREHLLSGKGLIKWAKQDDSHWKIPPTEWLIVVQHIEQNKETLRQVAHDYDVSYEAVRLAIRAHYMKNIPNEDLLYIQLSNWRRCCSDSMLSRPYCLITSDS